MVVNSGRGVEAGLLLFPLLYPYPLPYPNL